MILWLLGCATTIDEDEPCKEVGYAIAGRAQTCTGDTDLAESRYDAFTEEFTCIPADARDTAVRAEDLYACPLAIRNLACELVEEYGDDLARYLTASPTCALLVEAP